MSQPYDNTNRGGIWKNDRKETEKHPDFSGHLDVEGVDYWVSGWKRAPDANPKAPALSISIKRKDAQPEATPQQPESQQDSFADDDIPF